MTEVKEILEGIEQGRAELHAGVRELQIKLASTLGGIAALDAVLETLKAREREEADKQGEDCGTQPQTAEAKAWAELAAGGIRVGDCLGSLTDQKEAAHVE